jgi:chromosome segregation protein
MEDVIFHGTSARKSIGMAEVSLVFHNDGQLEVPWSEVAVARRLYRTGESEYLLNRNVCRLRDIQDLFAGTGVNPKAYALMDQERLNHVLTAKPWERRIFIEEAAGIARYKQQRAETQGKLEATRQNLTRVRDVMEEVRRQLGSIERQARKARQYKALHQEKQVLDLALLAADWAALAAQHEALTREMAELHETEERERTRIAGPQRPVRARDGCHPGDGAPAHRPAPVRAEDPERGRAPARAAGADGGADPRSGRGGRAPRR